MSRIKYLLGKRIKELRLAKNLTQENLSEITGIGTSSISKIESGIFHPSDENLEKIAEALEIEPYKLYMYNHHKSIDDLRADLYSMIKNANEKNLKLAYKILISIFDT